MLRIVKSIALVLLAATFIGLGNYGVAAANERTYRATDITFLVDDETTIPQCGGSGVSQLVGNDNIEKAVNFFISSGLNLAQAAGIAGNLDVESVGIQPDRQEFGRPWPRGGWGIAQWTNPERRDNIAKATRTAGLDYKNGGYSEAELEQLLLFQLNYLWEEALSRKGRGPRSSSPHNLSSKSLNTIEIMKKTTSARDATIMWEYEFERAGVPHLNARIKSAENIYNAFSNKIGDAGVSLTCNSGNTVVDENGFHFPLITTVEAIRTGVDGARWCFASTSNCHHDYFAADIHVPVGTPVVAARGGTVKRSIEQRGGVGSRLTIAGEDNNLYYYTHLSFNSLTVSEGDSVIAGQQLGTVGPRNQAVNTAPHLHFDMLPPGNSFRPGCSGAACKNYNFIDVQPILKRLFDKMEVDI